MPDTTTTTATSPVRLRDWQLLYEAFITQRFATPFAWGTQDCCTFAADCVLAITGVDVAHPDLRLHRTQAQAAATLARMGGVKRIATAALGPHRGAQFASVGDVVMVTMPDPSGTPQKALAVCNGANAWVPSSLGLVPVSLRGAIWCWRVG